jgi:hypothetical protein
MILKASNCEIASCRCAYAHVGTSISLFGTLDKPNDFGIPSAYFKLDDLPTEKFNRTGNVKVDNFGITTSHTRLYQSPALNQGSHKLTVTINQPTKLGTRFIVDYFTVGIASDVDVTTQNVIVDDSDARIVYSEGWIEAGATAEYMGTTHATPRSGLGDAALLFYGMSLVCYLTLGPVFPDALLLFDFTRNSCDCLRNYRAAPPRCRIRPRWK